MGNIKMDLEVVVHEGMDWIHLVWGVNMVTSFWGFLEQLGEISF